MLIFIFSTGAAGCGSSSRELLLEETGQEYEETPEGTEEKKEAAEETSAEREPAALSPTPAVTEAPGEIFVDVCGAVSAPGVYAMKPESRVFQAVEAAGGFLPEAAGNCINQAQALCDGQQIYVPTKEEARDAGMKPAAEALQTGNGQENAPTEGGTSGERVNLNTADSTALQTLSGIGEAKAQAIIAYREEHGSFQTPEDLMNVPGIKEGTFLKIKDKIAVE